MTHKLFDERWEGSGRFFRSVYENANDAIFLMDNDTFIDCNRKTEEMFGCSADEILDRKPYDFSPGEQPDGRNSKEKAEEYINAAIAGTAQFFEWKHRRIDGALFDAEVSLSAIDVDGRKVILAMVRDISRRKQAEDELKKAYEELEERVRLRTTELLQANERLQEEVGRRREMQEALGESETRYWKFLENFNGIVLEMDVDGNVTFMNRYGCRFFGFKNKEIVGKSVIGTIVPAIGTSGEDLRQLMQNITKNPEQYFNSENENIRKSGEKVWISWTNRVVYHPDKNRTEVLCIGVDRTEQKRAQDRLSEEITERAAATERNRLARELHDAVSQTLFSASLVAEVLPRIWKRDENEGLKRLEEVRQLSKSALAEMRTLLFELRPATLLEAEPEELLKQLADTVSGRYRIPVEIEKNVTEALPPEIKLTFYRVAQEALNNITKHAEATEVKIEFTCDDTGAMLRIRDNGKGFDMATLRPENMGVSIMKERAETISADIEINSELEKGTTVQLIWQSGTKDAE